MVRKGYNGIRDCEMESSYEQMKVNGGRVVISLVSDGEGKGSEAIKVHEWAINFRLVRIFLLSVQSHKYIQAMKKSYETHVNCDDRIAELI